MIGIALFLAATGMWLIATPGGRTTAQRRNVGPRAVLIGLGAGITGFLVTIGLTTAAFPAIGVGLLGAAIPGIIGSTRRRRAAEAMATAWPDVLSVIRSRLGSGSPIRDAFLDAITAHPAFEPWSSHLIGRDFDAALSEFATAIDDPVTDRVVATIGVAHRVGGAHTGRIIGDLARSVGDELRVRQSHEASVTEQRLTMVVALLAPWALLVLTTATNERAAQLYATPSGAVVVAVGLAATVVGFALARRTMRLARIPRPFR